MKRLVKSVRETIPISKIKIPPYYIRTRMESVARLSRSFYTHGLIDRVQITEDYYLFDGGRRLKGWGKETRGIEVDKLIGVNKDNMLEFQLMKISHKKGLNPIDFANALRNYIRTENISIREASRRLTGISKSKIEFYLKLLELPKKIRDRVYEGKIKPYALEKLVYRKRIRKARDFNKYVKSTQYRSILNRLTFLKSAVKSKKLDKKQLYTIKYKFKQLIKIVDERLNHAIS